MKPPTQKPIQRDQAEKAAEVFGLSVDGLEEDDVVSAFRLMVRAAHPDTGAKPDESAKLISVARETRAILLRWLSEQPDPECAQCDGSGWVPAGNGRVRACTNPRCGGV